MKQFLIILSLVSTLNSYNVQHLKKLKKQLSLKEKNINISHVDFRGLGHFLENVDLSNVQACGALFSEMSLTPIPVFAGLIQVPGQLTNLSNVNFSNASLVSTNFKGAILHNVNFSNADLAYANFSNADLTGAKLNKAKNIELAMFCDAIMPDGTKPTGSIWTSPTGHQIQVHCSH
ncbi:pentapeptide repeat-containing protein [Candidatus Babeliales bacterium]|nr:pentapeptide repeat-containing protein [Candidatus Babeliales bacterium]